MKVIDQISQRQRQRQERGERDRFPETIDAGRRRQLHKALRRRRAANKVAKQARKRNREAVRR